MGKRQKLWADLLLSDGVMVREEVLNYAMFVSNSESHDSICHSFVNLNLFKFVSLASDALELDG